MCLNVNNIDPRLAINPIVVYKIVNSLNSTRKQYEPNKTYNETRSFKNNLPRVQLDGFQSQVDKGFHSYTKAAALANAAPYNKVVEFTIPAGSLYYHGFHNSLSGNNKNEEGYCSAQIVSGNLVDIRKPIKKTQARDAYGRFC